MNNADAAIKRAREIQALMKRRDALLNGDTSSVRGVSPHFTANALYGPSQQQMESVTPAAPKIPGSDGPKR